MTAEEIKNARKSLGVTQTQFGGLLGVSLQAVQTWEGGSRNISGSALAMLKKILSEKNTSNTFINKSGNKFTVTTNGQKIIEVPILPFEAYAKYLDEHSDVSFFDEFEKVTFAVDKLGKGNYLGFKVSGDSMNGGRIDDTPDKAIVLGRELQKSLWLDGFGESRHGWIILTNKNILFKDIIAFDKEKATIMCHSRNGSPEYCDFPLLLNDVYQIFKVIKRTF